MDCYKKTKKIFKEKVRGNKELSKEQWDKHSQSNCLFCANTLMFHVNAKSFEDLKIKLS